MSYRALSQVAATKLIEQEQTEITENPLFCPFTPVQLSSIRGPGALGGSLMQPALRESSRKNKI